MLINTDNEGYKRAGPPDEGSTQQLALRCKKSLDAPVLRLGDALKKQNQTSNERRIRSWQHDGGFFPEKDQP